MKNKNRKVRKLPFPRTCAEIECDKLFDSIEFTEDGAKIKMYDRQYCLSCRPPAYNKQNYCEVERLSDEEFKEIVSTSSTYNEIARKMGKERAFSKIRAQIVRRLDRTPGLKMLPYIKSKYSLKDIFSENSSVSSAWVKQVLLENNLKNYICERKGCGNIGEWNGRPLTLQLDHINGNRKDNRLENLRFLCLNCHSQTNTYSGANIKYE